MAEKKVWVLINRHPDYGTEVKITGPSDVTVVTHVIDQGADFDISGGILPSEEQAEEWALMHERAVANAPQPIRDYVNEITDEVRGNAR
jgi:hypothetical protein